MNNVEQSSAYKEQYVWVLVNAETQKVELLYADSRGVYAIFPQKKDLIEKVIKWGYVNKNSSFKRFTCDFKPNTVVEYDAIRVLTTHLWRFF